MWAACEGGAFGLRLLAREPFMMSMFCGQGAYLEPQNSKTLNVKCKSQVALDQRSVLLLHFAVLHFAVLLVYRSPHKSYDGTQHATVAGNHSQLTTHNSLPQYHLNNLNPVTKVTNPVMERITTGFNTSANPAASMNTESSQSQASGSWSGGRSLVALAAWAS